MPRWKMTIRRRPEWRALTLIDPRCRNILLTGSAMSPTIGIETEGTAHVRRRTSL